MSSLDNYVIITSKRFLEKINNYLEFKRNFYNIPKRNIITVEEIEKSNYYKMIKDEDLIDTVIEEYKKVIDTTNLNPIQIHGKSKFMYKMAEAIKAKIIDLSSNIKISYLLIIGDSGIVPPYCYYWKGADSSGYETTITYFSDQIYGDLDFEDSHIEVAVFRIAVVSNFTFTEVLDKILGYEKYVHDYINNENKNSDKFNWIKRICLFPDTTNGNDFLNAINKIKTYLENIEDISERLMISQEDSQENTIEKFNRGSVFWIYFGRGDHSGWNAVNGINNTMIKNLENNKMLPIVISNGSSTCSVQYERRKIFGQQLLNKKNGGSVFTIGPSYIMDLDISTKVVMQFLKEIFENKRITNF
ncbi:MAG: C25 family cysteine peptidase [Candidatus Helarchaeota archaeon]